MDCQVCLLFNIAALATQKAKIQNLDSEEGFQIAKKTLLSAGGIFTALKEMVVGLPEQVKGTPPNNRFQSIFLGAHSRSGACVSGTYVKLVHGSGPGVGGAEST